MQHSAVPWLSPKVVTENNLPKVFPDIRASGPNYKMPAASQSRNSCALMTATPEPPWGSSIHKKGTLGNRSSSVIQVSPTSNNMSPSGASTLTASRSRPTANSVPSASASSAMRGSTQYSGGSSAISARDTYGGFAKIISALPLQIALKRSARSAQTLSDRPCRAIFSAASDSACKSRSERITVASGKASAATRPRLPPPQHTSTTTPGSRPSGHQGRQ